MGYRRLQTDGGEVEYVVSGPADAGDLLLFHVGSPSAAVEYPGLARAAAAAGMRVACYSRGGYGTSTRCAGRSVADEAEISGAVADTLGHERFFTIGWSGGGPVALACAALLPGRVRGAMALASISPPVEVGPSWREFWTPAQRKEWDDLAAGDTDSLAADFQAEVPRLAAMTPARLLAVGGPPDARSIAHGHAEEIAKPLARSMRRAVRQGHVGYLDDNLAQARDWGFRVADIRVPVVVRHGELDRLVPIGHGRWLGSAIPGAKTVILPDAGHGSIALPWVDVIRDLLEAAQSR